MVIEEQKRKGTIGLVMMTKLKGESRQFLTKSGTLFPMIRNRIITILKLAKFILKKSANGYIIPI